MKPNKYNPQIPNKFDGQLPSDWQYRQYPIRVKLFVTPIQIPWVPPQHLQMYYGHGAFRYFLSYPQFENDYETPYENTIKALEHMMPGDYVLDAAADMTSITLYCHEWLDPVVIKLMRDADNPTALDRASIEYLHKSFCKTNHRYAKGLIARFR